MHPNFSAFPPEGCHWVHSKQKVTRCILCIFARSLLRLNAIHMEMKVKAYIAFSESIWDHRREDHAEESWGFTPVVTAKGSQYSQSSCILAVIPSWNCQTIAKNFSGQPNVAMIFHSFSRQTVSDTFVRFTKDSCSLLACRSRWMIEASLRSCGSFSWDRCTLCESLPQLWAARCVDLCRDGICNWCIVTGKACLDFFNFISCRWLD